MSSAKRKPRTPSPLEDEEGQGAVPQQVMSPQDMFAGRRVSVSEFAGQELLDYEDVASPGASSTSSEPTYVRQPGFDAHAHEVASTSDGGQHKPSKGSQSKGSKKKKSSPADGGEGEISIVAMPTLTATRPKTKREPLPMKQRALPQSFWVQPNRASNLPPSGTLLPPLMLGKDAHDVIEVRPVTPPEDSLLRQCSGNEGKYSIASPSPTLSIGGHSTLNLHHSPSVPSLATYITTSPSTSSLSTLIAPPSSSSPPSSSQRIKDPGGVGGSSSPPGPSSSRDSPPGGAKSGSPPPVFHYERRGERVIKVGNTDLLFSLFDKVEQGDKKRLHLVRRGRPRKPPNPSLPRHRGGEDPCLVGPVGEGILPQLPDSTPHSSGSSTPLGMRQGTQVLEMVSLRDGDRTISLPSLNLEHNYGQILSELVMKL